MYRYTHAVLEEMVARDVRPQMVQVGNETNCGMMATEASPGFPPVSTCDGHWRNQGLLLNAGIRAIREVSPETRIMLHVAQPEFVGPFMDGITSEGGVTDFDLLGFSYYEKWSEEALTSISGHVGRWREAYGVDVILVETSYPWTMENADGYGNILGEDSLTPGYPPTVDGQRRYMVDLVQQVMDGGGTGVFYWEPAWIPSDLTDLWGTGSAWDNATLFDHQGRAHGGMAYLTHGYDTGS